MKRQLNEQKVHSTGSKINNWQIELHATEKASGKQKVPSIGQSGSLPNEKNLHQIKPWPTTGSLTWLQNVQTPYSPVLGVFTRLTLIPGFQEVSTALSFQTAPLQFQLSFTAFCHSLHPQTQSLPIQLQNLFYFPIPGSSTWYPRAPLLLNIFESVDCSLIFLCLISDIQ